jgi:hypothetical protein
MMAKKKEGKLNREKKRVSLLLPVLLDGRTSTDSAGCKTQKNFLLKRSLPSGLEIKEPSSIT